MIPKQNTALTGCDLHLHSSCSDGSDCIPALISNVRRSGICVFSVTDHDTIDACSVLRTLAPPDLEWFSGVEFSCQSPLQKCHILGYDFQPEHPALCAAVAESSRLRRIKLDVRIHHLKTVHGIALTGQELDGLYAQNSVGKPHIARILVERGIAPDIDSAIHHYLNGCKTVRDRIDAASAIRAISDAGGIPVWAHPLGGEGARHLTEPEFYARLEELIALGIRGLECHYSRYSGEEIRFLRSAAQQHGLLISGGSDYHGANKTIRIGELSADGTPAYDSQLTLLAALRRRKH